LHKEFVLISIISFCLISANAAFAQLSVGNSSEKKEQMTVALGSPVIYKISDKRLYNVTIKSAESSQASGLNFEIVFLNATSGSFSSSPSNASSTASQEVTVPAVVENVVPVKSFDIKVLTKDGKELAKKINEIPNGGRILENINLNNYTGIISIKIDNIVPDPSVADILKKQLTSNSNQTDLRDSVNMSEQIQRS
jgi:hypothetical protein